MIRGLAWDEAVLDAELVRAAVAGHHTPGTGYSWKHGWEPLTFEAAKSHFHNHVPPYWHAPGEKRTERVSGVMKHGDWHEGHQAVSPAPVHVLGNEGTRYVHGQTVHGSWSDPWWMTKPGGGWAVSRRWRSKPQTGYDWSGGPGGRARTFDIPAMDERALTPVDATGQPLERGGPRSADTREFPALGIAVKNAQAKAASMAEGYPAYIIRTPMGHWEVTTRRPSWGSYFAVDKAGNWSRTGAGPGYRRYGEYLPDVVKMDGPPTDEKLLDYDHPANQQYGATTKLEVAARQAEREAESAHEVYVMALRDAQGSGGSYDPNSPQAQVAEKLRLEWLAAQQRAAVARGKAQAAVLKAGGGGQVTGKPSRMERERARSMVGTKARPGSGDLAGAHQTLTIAYDGAWPNPNWASITDSLNRAEKQLQDTGLLDEPEAMLHLHQAKRAAGRQDTQSMRMSIDALRSLIEQRARGGERRLMPRASGLDPTRSGAARSLWNPRQHPRVPGGAAGGQFTNLQPGTAAPHMGRWADQIAAWRRQVSDRRVLAALDVAGAAAEDQDADQAAHALRQAALAAEAARLAVLAEKFRRLAAGLAGRPVAARAGWDAAKHPRVPSGEHGGQFTHLTGTAEFTSTHDFLLDLNQLADQIEAASPSTDRGWKREYAAVKALEDAAFQLRRNRHDRALVRLEDAERELNRTAPGHASLPLLRQAQDQLRAIIAREHPQMLANPLEQTATVVGQLADQVRGLGRDAPRQAVKALDGAVRQLRRKNPSGAEGWLLDAQMALADSGRADLAGRVQAVVDGLRQQRASRAEARPGLVAVRHGHWKHEWVPLDYAAAEDKFHGRVPQTWRPGVSSSDPRKGTKLIGIVSQHGRGRGRALWRVSAADARKIVNEPSTGGRGKHSMLVAFDHSQWPAEKQGTGPSRQGSQNTWDFIPDDGRWDPLLKELGVTKLEDKQHPLPRPGEAQYQRGKANPAFDKAAEELAREINTHYGNRHGAPGAATAEEVLTVTPPYPGEPVSMWRERIHADWGTELPPLPMNDALSRAAVAGHHVPGSGYDPGVQLRRGSNALVPEVPTGQAGRGVLHAGGPRRDAPAGSMSGRDGPCRAYPEVGPGTVDGAVAGAAGRQQGVVRRATACPARCAQAGHRRGHTGRSSRPVPP